MSFITEKRDDNRQWVKLSTHNSRADALAVLPFGTLRRTGDTSELVTEDGVEYRVRRVTKKKRINVRELMAGVGLKRVRGTAGGIYYE